MSYPVLEILHELKKKLAANPVVILQAPPGAGKSTVLPLELLNEPWLHGKKIIMLEPRRLAAKSVAERMANLQSEEVGQQIGYRVRFDSRVSQRTKLEVVTEGILTRMIQSDNSLEEVGLLIFDEFHERSLNADLALALALQVQHILRDDLRILIMSATFDSEKLSALIGNAPILTSTGKQFAVDIRYSTIETDVPVVDRVLTTLRKAIREETGDALVFLPGAGEIRNAEEKLRAENIDAVIYPLYGDLSFKQQQDAILPRKDGQRKIVLATSIAETSLTIEGIRVVIDAGLSRVSRFDPRSGLTKLETIRVTKDSADQRAGRAGRLGPGICFRLWTEAAHRHLIPERKPEILEADLAPLLLELAQWGINDVNAVKWITPPNAGAVNQARELLVDLEALDSSGAITKWGREMVKLPTHPRIAHMLIQNKSEVAADVAALLEERDPLPKDAGADLALRVEVLQKWRQGERVNADRNVLERINKLSANWRRLLVLSNTNAKATDSEIGRALVAAYPERIAQQQGAFSERYKLTTGRIAKLPDHDPLTREPWICVAQLDAGAKEGKIFLAAAVHEKDLKELAYERDTVRWDDERKAVVAVSEKRVGNLVLESKPSKKTDDDARVNILLAQIRAAGLRLLGWSEAEEQWQARVESLRIWREKEPWPNVSDNALLSTLENWLTPFLINVSKQSELEKLDKQSMLTGILPWELQSKLDVLAPLRLTVPSGSQIRLQYFSEGKAPVMEVRLQEMFGLLETPTINEGRTKILLHLLSPGYKPVQVTQDLNSFWQTTYHEVRKELRMRYPKHHWPEDPWTAEAVRGVKKKF